MGDVRFDPLLERLTQATDRRAALAAFTDEDVVSALAAASRVREPYLANVLATEAMNRTRRHSVITYNLADGVCAVGATGSITTVNPAAVRMLRAAPTALIDKDLTATPMFLRLNPRPHPVEATLATGTIEEGETTFERADGSTFLAAYSVTPVLRDGDVMGAVLLFRDVSQARETQRLLAESEERYKLAIAGARDGLWDWDPRADDLACSDRWREIAAIVDARFPRRMTEWIARIHHEDAPRFESVLRAHLAGLLPSFQVEHRFRHPDGSYRWVLARAASVRGADGRVRRVAGSLTDIEPRKALQEEERREHARLGRILDAAPDALVELTPDAEFVQVSSNAPEVFGAQPEDLLSASLYEFVAPEQVPVVARAHLAALHEPGVASATFDCQPRVGPATRVEAALRAGRDADGAEPRRIVMILRRLSPARPPGVG